MASSNNIDELYAEACACIEQGLCYDEINDHENATCFYDRSIALTNEAGKQKNCQENSLYRKMLLNKKCVERRLTDIIKQKQSETKANNKKGEEKVIEELKSQIGYSCTSEVELICYIPGGVQLLTIEGDSTTIPSYPSSLEIFRLNCDESDTDLFPTKAFIQISSWSYPLIPGRTPVLKNDFGAYVVPNPTPGHPDMFVGILLPKSIGADEEKKFCDILKQYAEFRTHDLSRSLSKQEREHLSQRLGDLLVKGSLYLAENINAVQEKTSKVFSEHSTRLRSTLKTDEEPVVVNRGVRYGVHYVHKGSKIVAKCTRYLLNKVGDLGIAVGQKLAASAEKHRGADGDEPGIVGGAIYILGSSVVGASTVWMALENASKTLAKNIANETVDTIKHKWGDDLSLTAYKALSATGHSTLVAIQLWDFGPRSIAGRAARKAGMQFVTDLRERNYKNDDNTI